VTPTPEHPQAREDSLVIDDNHEARGALRGYAGRKGAYPTKLGVAVVIGLFALTLFVAKGCQNNQIKVGQDQAVALAEKQIHFAPESTQIRLLRQGLDRHPFWVVSLSIPFNTPDDPRGFRQLAVVRIDATNGDVASVQDQSVDSDSDSGGSDAGQKEP
jgi:hypothetical protein